MFNFNGANLQQIEAIKTTEGPVLIIAGPGTGKTFTLVNRIIYLIQQLNVNPESIMIATFTEKAAKELITRISNELMNRNMKININDMYIGTFHSICLRILKEQSEYTNLRKNFSIMDAFDQQYFIYQNLHKFKSIKNSNLIIEESSVWMQSENLCKYINGVREELIDINELKSSKELDVIALGDSIDLYEKLINNKNAVDFTSIQTKVYELFHENPDILKEYRENIKYIMVDEYQDTNYIQEQLVFLLSSDKKNICVVGDEDQGLYRFRGATIRNILEFPNKFDDSICKIVKLTKNYRSTKEIIDFYNKWMNTTDGRKFKFKWENYRYKKTITFASESMKAINSVFKITGEDDNKDWYEKLLKFIVDLKNTGTINDYNQIAFLANSIKGEAIQSLTTFLELNGIGIYAPRSDLFFERREVKLTIGIFLLVFPSYIQKLDRKEIKWLSDRHYNYYEESIRIALNLLSDNDNNVDLKYWIKKKGLLHLNLIKSTDYAFLGMFYELFQFEPFQTMLSIDMEVQLIDQREARNLALLSDLIGKFEHAENITVFTTKNIDKIVDKFFSQFLRFLMDGGIGEYEDESQYAPSGCISFLTIHQSKGMEFPIVIVDSLGNVPRKKSESILQKIFRLYQKKEPFEPEESIKYYDFWRLYYTAFSRAQDILVLSCNSNARTPSKYFEEHYNDLTEYSPININLSKFNINEIKDVILKKNYSFTSDIAVYNNCTMQYKFFKELAFTQMRVGSTAFGTLVHQTIEDIHKTILKGEVKKINKDNIEKWFSLNYISIVENQKTYLGEGQLNAALEQVMRYVDRQKNRWDHIKDSEVEVSLVKDKYILKGNIDLIQGENDTIEIVDFKAEKKPDLIKDKSKIEHYKKQLQIYAHLVEEKEGKKVSRMNLYYTGADNENPVIQFPRNSQSIENTVKEFDEIVNKIQGNKFDILSKDQIICSNCDMRYYCKR